jgi:predicted GNAT family N-acyltransferase
MITINIVQTEKELKEIFKIREEVFVLEQQVDPSEEYDEFEDTSIHFIATDEDGNPCGTARWRFTRQGIKLERFAVLKSHRGKGVGYALVKAVLENIATKAEAQGKLQYMHAQLSAVTLYEKFGFQKKGDQFEECNIMHYQMELMPA